MSAAPSLLLLGNETGDDQALLGGKAASLVRLMRSGAAVPPAVVLTTEAYRRWSAEGVGEHLTEWVAQGVAALERTTGRTLGTGHGGLIVSVRSGAPVSMPGMMDTVLNVGLGPIDENSPVYIRDARRRFLLQFFEIVVGVDEERIKEIAQRFPERYNVAQIHGLEAALAPEAEKIGLSWPLSPEDEIRAAAAAVFASWDSSRAKLYRKMRRIDDSLGTAVTIQQMVFGNFDPHSGSGVAFTRDPTTGAPGLCGEYLGGGQGEEVVAGRETAAPLPLWERDFPSQCQQLRALGEHLEGETGKVHEIEFTLESGRLYILQCRPALLTKVAAARIAVDMVRERRLSTDQALAYARQHGFDPNDQSASLAIADQSPAFASGLPVGGGIAAGRLAFSDRASIRMAQSGEPVIFATVETSPSLLPVMQRSAGLVTMLGGATSHAAVVARQLGTPCVVGLGGAVEGGSLEIGGRRLQEGDWVTVNGDSGEIYEGDVAVAGGESSADEAELRKWASQADISADHV